ncbi:MAG: hypothetical protein R3Y13_01335 [bacterium]
MNDYVFSLIFFLVVFFSIFTLQYTVFVVPKIKPNLKNKAEAKKIVEIEYLSMKFKLDKEKLMNSKVGTMICYLNSFIIALVSTLVTLLPCSETLQLLIGFVLLLVIIYIVYEIFGKFLSKKLGGEKNEL